MAYVEHTNQNTPNFVALHNSQQHVLQEFIDTNLVKEQTLEEKALAENQALSDLFEQSAKTINEMSNSLSQAKFWPYNDEYTSELEASTINMFNKWRIFTESVRELMASHDALANDYAACINEQITKGITGNQ